MFPETLTEVMGRRRSCRTYVNEPLPPEVLAELEGTVSAITTTPFGNLVRFRLFDLAAMAETDLRDAGTYGVIKGARYFIAGAVRRGQRAMEDFGFAMEGVILKATAMNLGTCWLGGTFNRSGFARLMDTANDELIPAVTPVGRSADQKSAVERLFRFAARSDRRKPWEDLFFEDFPGKPLSPEAAGVFNVPLECVRLAPSASNKQPWRIVKDGGLFHFLLAEDKRYNTLLGEIKLQNIDMGIAMHHFAAAVHDIGLDGVWEVMDPPHAHGRLQYICTWKGL